MSLLSSISMRCAITLALPCASPALAAIPGIELVDQTTISSYIDSNGPATGPVATSSDGRFVLFWSSASNLVPGDSNDANDLFLFDADNGSIERVNVASDGSEAVGDYSSLSPPTRAGISADGRYVTFQSSASNLVAEPTGGFAQVYRRDRVSGTTTLISRGLDGLPASGYVSSGATTPDGRYVVVVTGAANLPDTSNGSHVFRIDTTNGAIVKVSATLDDGPAMVQNRGTEISDDGRFVMFMSFADHIVPGGQPGTVGIFLRDIENDTTHQVNVTDTGALPPPGWTGSIEEDSDDRLSADGRYAVFSTFSSLSAADTDDKRDVYRFDRLSGTTTLVSTGHADFAPPAISLGPSISAGGDRVLFFNIRNGFGTTQQFIRNMSSATLTPVALPPPLLLHNSRQMLSRDGSTMFFSAYADSWVSNMQAAYRLHLPTATLTRVSKAPDWSSGPYANGTAELNARPAASSDGRYVAFSSAADNLVPGDTNGVVDVFVRDRWNATTERVSMHANGDESACASTAPTMTPDARYVVFESCGALTAPASGTQGEIYRYDRQDGSLDLVSVAASGERADAGSATADVSDDGNSVVFWSCARNLVAISGGVTCQCYVRDLGLGLTALVSRAGSGEPAAGSVHIEPRISGNGRFVGYTSAAANLVPGDTNNQADAFVFDRRSSTTERISMGPAGQQGAGTSSFGAINRDGSLVLFKSQAFGPPGGSDGTRSYLRNRTTGTTMLLGIPDDASSSSSDATISADGRFIALIARNARSGVGSYDDRFKDKLFLLDRNSGQYRALTWFWQDGTERMTARPQLTASGNAVAFVSTRSDLTDDDGNDGIANVFIALIDDAIFTNGFDQQAGAAPR